MSFYLREDDTIRGGRVFGTVAAAVLLVVGIVVGIYVLTYATAETRGRIALHNQQRSAEALQFNYEYFHDQCHAVLTDQQNLQVAKNNLKALTAAKPATDPFGQYAQTLVESQNQISDQERLRNQAAQDYNSKSHQFTRNFIKSNDLPVEIGPPTGEPYESLVCEGVHQ